jgi:hypothetical protein
MAFTSILKPDGSIGMGIATMVVTYAIYDHALPDMATIHATDAGDINIEAARKKAAWTSAAAVSAITLLTKDVNILILGGVMLFALDMHTRHANATNPDTGNLVTSGYGQATPLRSVPAA